MSRVEREQLTFLKRLSSSPGCLFLVRIAQSLVFCEAFGLTLCLINVLSVLHWCMSPGYLFVILKPFFSFFFSYHSNCIDCSSSMYSFWSDDLFRIFKILLRGYHTLQGDNSLKSAERFDHMMFVGRCQASRWSKPKREKLLCG